ncbi:MAG: hypothetical protein DLM65_12365 [Candidatus Aeolococcus gillhamiae]|uniref:Uncharacterized protein n=1 Tax=Candidatus Aeolococcus gillhamiae TaxID=3127015 RepID=A0A2W5ZZG0_9BACT|nr:MAG: hypothetical protein DLM65_12365 [Candidatus Dormibacter sp. RRmetagenome_bin12]
MGSEYVRFGLSWNWEGLDETELQRRHGELRTWVNWFVARYHLVGRVPRCWDRHPGLVDELKALWYYHEEVTNPLVPVVDGDQVHDPSEPEDPEVLARAYHDWHEARWRWMTGPLADAAGYRECLARQEHVDDGHASDARAFAEASAAGVEEPMDTAQVLS